MGVVQPSPKGIASASFTESVGLGASKPIAFWRPKKAGMYGRRLCAASDQNHRRICVTNHVFGALPLMAIMLSRKQEHRATARSITDFPTKATNAGGACTPHRDGCNPALTRPHDSPAPCFQNNYISWKYYQNLNGARHIAMSPVKSPALRPVPRFRRGSCHWHTPGAPVFISRCGVRIPVVLALKEIAKCRT